jgi:hypothetical protein
VITAASCAPAGAQKIAAREIEYYKITKALSYRENVGKKKIVLVNQLQTPKLTHAGRHRGPASFPELLVQGARILGKSKACAPSKRINTGTHRKGSKKHLSESLS